MISIKHIQTENVPFPIISTLCKTFGNIYPLEQLYLSIKMKKSIKTLKILFFMLLKVQLCKWYSIFFQNTEDHRVQSQSEASERKMYTFPFFQNFPIISTPQLQKTINILPKYMLYQFKGMFLKVGLVKNKHRVQNLSLGQFQC